MGLADEPDDNVQAGPEPKGREVEEASDSESSAATISDVDEILERPDEVQDSDHLQNVSMFPGIPKESQFVHRLSVVIHVASEDDYFLCGRERRVNFRPLADVSRNGNFSSPVPNAPRRTRLGGRLSSEHSNEIENELTMMQLHIQLVWQSRFIGLQPLFSLQT